MTEQQRTLLEEGCAQLESRAGLIWGPEFIEEFAAAIRALLAEVAALKADVIAEQGYRAAAEEIARRRGEMVDALTAERDEAREQLRLANIDQFNSEAENASLKPQSNADAAPIPLKSWVIEVFQHLFHSPHTPDSWKRDLNQKTTALLNAIEQGKEAKP